MQQVSDLRGLNLVSGVATAAVSGFCFFLFLKILLSAFQFDLVRFNFVCLFIFVVGFFIDPNSFPFNS